MKRTTTILLLLTLTSATIGVAQKHTKQRPKPGAVKKHSWQHYDSLANAEIDRGDTSAAISYLECAAALNNTLKPALDKLKRKFQQDGNSFYLKEY